MTSRRRMPPTNALTGEPLTDPQGRPTGPSPNNAAALHRRGLPPVSGGSKRSRTLRLADLGIAYLNTLSPAETARLRQLNKESISVCK